MDLILKRNVCDQGSQEEGTKNHQITQRSFKCGYLKFSKKKVKIQLRLISGVFQLSGL